MTRPRTKLKSLSEERRQDFVARIDKLSYGSIVINGKKHMRDVLIFADGTVRKRKGSFLVLGSHNIRKEEIEQLAQAEPEVMVIGTGTHGNARLASDIKDWARESNLILIVQPSYEAIIKLNELTEQGKKVAALIHITC